MGFFYRTIRMVENGIKPVYVFDGKPPELKSGVVSDVLFSQRFVSNVPQLSKRFERREEAKEEGEEAKETGMYYSCTTSSQVNGRSPNAIHHPQRYQTCQLRHGYW